MTKVFLYNKSDEADRVGYNNVMEHNYCKSHHKIKQSIQETDL